MSYDELETRVSALEAILMVGREDNRLDRLESDLGRKVRWLIGLQVLTLTSMLGAAATIIASAV